MFSDPRNIGNPFVIHDADTATCMFVIGRWWRRLAYELGSGRARDNARQDQVDAAVALTAVAGLEARLAARTAASHRPAA